MNDRHDPLTDPISTFLDDLVSGNTLPGTDPTTDSDLASLQSSASHFHRLAHAGEAHAAPSSRRAWESIMADLRRTTTGSQLQNPSRQRAHPSGARSAVELRRWQPAISFAIVIGLLSSVIALTYELGVLDAPESSNTHAAIVESTPDDSAGCFSNGEPGHTSEEIAEMSIDDWPTPEYWPVAVADPATGETVLDTYIGYYTCENAFLFGSEERQVGDPLSDEMLSYQSDRYRFVMAPNTWRTSIHDVVPADTLEQASDEILRSFPLPINRPSTIYWFPGTTFGVQVFSPGDVYELTDGRYGVMLGTTSITTLRNPPEDIVDSEKNLTFVAFVKIDGRFYIDEYVPICMGIPGSATMEGTPVPTPVPDELQDSVVRACL